MAKKGRPNLGRDACKVVLHVRVSPNEINEWKRKAKAAGMSLSKWVLAPRRGSK